MCIRIHTVIITGHLTCYNDIILVHNKVWELWYNVYPHISGPQVDKILHKSISVFSKLASTRVNYVIGFYDRLQEVSMGYSLALMPFDAIVLKKRFEGLCPPGLGLIRYAAMCKAFMKLLPCVTMNQQAVLDDDQAVLGLFDKYCEL